MMDDGFSEVITDPTHNQPKGLREGAELADHIKLTHGNLLIRGRELVDAEPRLPAIVDEETESQATEFVKMIQVCEKALDQARIAEKGPYDDAASLVHAIFRGVQDKLVRQTKGAPAALKERVEQRLTAYKLARKEAARKIREEAARKAREEEDRLRREAMEAARAAEAAAAAAARKRTAEAREAARIAAEAAEAKAAVAREEERQAANARALAEKAAAVPTADLTRSRGARGGVGSLQTFWSFRDLDKTKIDLESLRYHFTIEAYEMAVRSFIKANEGQPLRGVEIFKDHRTAVR